MTLQQQTDIEHDHPIVALRCAVLDYCDLDTWDKEQQQAALYAIGLLKMKYDKQRNVA